MSPALSMFQIAKHVARNVLLAFVLTSGFFVVTVAVFQGSTFGDVTSLCGSPFERNLKARALHVHGLCTWKGSSVGLVGVRHYRTDLYSPPFNSLTSRLLQ